MHVLKIHTISENLEEIPALILLYLIKWNQYIIHGIMLRASMCVYISAH